MATISNFEEIIAWQQAKGLTIAIYANLMNYKGFGYRDQIQRAAVSVMNNIAEGFERRGDREFKHFLYIAKGSCAEVRSMLSIASELGYMSPGAASKLIEQTLIIRKLVGTFIGKLD